MADDDMFWLHHGNDDPLWVREIRENRYVGKPFTRERIQNMVNFPLRSDDVLICSYPKSGCHWIWETLRMLQCGEVKTDHAQKEETMMEYYNQDHFDSYPSPRILNNHLFFDEQPVDLIKGQTKVILLYRNPKDTCVSYFYHHSRIPSYKYNGKFENYLRRFAEGKISNNSCFDYFRMWEEGFNKHPNIPYLLVRYEDLHQNPVGERRRLASFLGREYDDAFLQKVADATSIDTMRQLKTTALKDAEGKSIMYRKGKVGDWKDHFTVSQSEWFDQMKETKMEGTKLFDFVYSID